MTIRIPSTSGRDLTGQRLYNMSAEPVANAGRFPHRWGSGSVVISGALVGLLPLPAACERYERAD